MNGKITGAFLNPTIFAIAKYLIGLNIFYEERGGGFNIHNQINYLLSTYNFVPVEQQIKLKTDILNAYVYLSNQTINAIDAAAFARFKLDILTGKLSPEKLELELLNELNELSY